MDILMSATVMGTAKGVSETGQRNGAKPISSKYVDAIEKRKRSTENSINVYLEELRNQSHDLQL